RRFPIVDRFLSDVEIRSRGDYLVEQGFRGLYPIVPEDRVGGRINQLALRIATLKDDGADYATEEAMLGSIMDEVAGKPVQGDPIEQGFFHARNLNLRSDGTIRAAFRHMPGERTSPIWTDDFEVVRFLLSA